MESLIPGDELVAEGQARHESPLLQPENGGKTSREEYSFYRGKSHNPLSVSSIIGVDPFESPVSLFLDGGKIFNGIEQLVSFLPVLDISVNEKAVHLAVNVFDGDLKAVEAPGLRPQACMNLSTRFSLTIPSDAAKNARTWEMKYFSSSFNFSFQSFKS